MAWAIVYYYTSETCPQGIELYRRTDTTSSGERSRWLVTMGDRGELPVDRYVTPATTTAATTHTHHHEGACHDSRPRCSSRRIRIMLVIVLLQWHRFGVHGGVRRRSGMLACVSIYCCDLIIQCLQFWSDDTEEFSLSQRYLLEGHHDHSVTR